jgi:hypothetical protein
VNRLHIVTLLCAALAAITPLRAQNYGEITGTVSDSSGAVVAEATVTITHVSTNAARQVKTNASGNYDAPFLVPGIYNVQAEHAGFKLENRNGIDLQVGAVARIDFMMQVGQISESVQVSGEAVLLNAEGTAVGTVIENKRIEDLPLNGRNYLQLVALSPNVTTQAITAGSAASKQGTDRVTQNISIAGLRVQMNHYTLDGIENTDVNYESSYSGRRWMLCRSSRWKAAFTRLNTAATQAKSMSPQSPVPTIII